MSADTVTPPPVPPQTTHAAPAASPPPPAAPRRRRRWFWRLLPLATLLACVWFAPAIVANTNLRNRVAQQALADLHGSVEIGSASLGWLSPVELRDVTIKDAAGRTLVSVAKVTSYKSLLTLARNQAQPGEFTLENPTIAIVCEQNTTNLETAFAEYLKDDGKPAPTRTPVVIRVSEGTLTITDTATGKTTSIEGISANVNVPATRAEPITAKLSATTGGISADVSVGEASSGQFIAKELPLEPFAPLLKRVDPTLTLAGTVTTDLRVSWSKDALAVSGTASAKQLRVEAPWLNGDKLALDSAELPLDVELAGRVLRVRKFDLACDFGTLSAAGTFNPDEPTEKLLTQPGVVLSGNVELAKLAKQLPKLLRLKDGLELREGKVEARLASVADGANTVWTGKILTSSIQALHEGKPITWDQPLTVDFTSRYASGKLPTFDKLICTSDFVAVNAKTTPETVQAAATVYLQRFTERLGQFVDLDGITLEGIANAQLVARLAPDGAFKASGLVEVSDFVFARSGKGLKEPAVKLHFGATGKAPANGAMHIATASAAIVADRDELHLTLLEPVSAWKKLASSRFDLSLTGDLARWKIRAAAFTTIPAYQMSGGVVASGKAQLSADRTQLTVDRLTIGLTNVKFRGAGIILDEPTMNAVGDLTFAQSPGVATIAKLTLNSAPLSITNGTLTFEVPQEGDVVVSGNGQCITDLNRLGTVVKLYTDARGPDALHGRGVGPLRFRSAGDVTSFGGTLDVTNFAYGPKDKPVWAEPTLRLEADGDYRDSTDAVTLALAKVERSGLALDAKGSVSKATTTQNVSFSGSLKYDWAKLTPLVREQLGESFTATGTGTRAIALSGQLSPLGAQLNATPAPKGGPITLKAPGAPVPAAPSIFAAMSGEAAIGWDTIKAYGFDVGAGDLKAKMTRGVLAVSPISATFCGGKVTIAPTVKLDVTPGEVTLAKGTVVDHAKLTPQATAGALGYALPAIANAGQAEGEISASIAENRIPLGDFTQTSLKGTLVIHKATIGASPVVAEVAKLLGAKSTTMTLATESAVPVQVANGRVYHQNFAVRIAGTTFHTSGSVGFDNTLDLVVDVPIPKDLPALKNNPLLVRAVAGKVVKVPVKGTLSQPAVDPKAFEQAVVTLIREGAKDVGKDVLDKELRKLFPGMPGAKPGGGLPFSLPFGRKP